MGAKKVFISDVINHNLREETEADNDFSANLTLALITANSVFLVCFSRK